MRLRKQILLCFKAPQSSRSFDKRKIIDLYFIRMKYVIVLGDGMADEYIPSISGTPLEKANIENARKLAKTAKIGLVKTVPDGFKPASDVANLAVLGYAPEKYYSGRSPLEALSIGVDMKDTDVAYRMNLVTLSAEKNFSDKTMVDYSAGEISTAETADRNWKIREKTRGRKCLSRISKNIWKRTPCIFIRASVIAIA